MDITQAAAVTRIFKTENSVQILWRQFSLFKSFSFYTQTDLSM